MGLNRYKEERKKEIFDERANFGISTSSQRDANSGTDVADEMFFHSFLK